MNLTQRRKGAKIMATNLMSKVTILSLVMLFSLFAFACSSKESPVAEAPVVPPPLSPDEEVAVIDTDFGKIRIRLYADVAPMHVENFKKLAREGFYNGLAFHRIIPNGIIQGGDPTTRGNDRSLWGRGEPGQPTVPAEFSARPFVRGAVGAARKGNDINSATSQFFICTAAQPGFDGLYSIFGRVLEGMNVVDTIARAPILGKTERPVDPVVVNRVYIIKRAELKKEQ